MSGSRSRTFKMKIRGLLLVSLWFNFCGAIFPGDSNVKQAVFDRFDGSCPGHNVPIIYDVQGIRTEGIKVWLNSTFTAKEDITGNPKLMVAMDRCKSKENLDSCEHVHTVNVKYCDMLDSANSLWKTYFEVFTPRWKCPIKKGVYRGTNSQLDLSAMLVLNGGDWYWRLKAELREKRTDKLLMCVNADISVTSGPSSQPATKG